MHAPEPGEAAPDFWNRLYRRSDRIWSGNVNVRLAEVAAELPPGRALDLGCGEGGDAMWLAERGWQVVATDISPVAIERASQDSQKRGLADRIEFVRTDLVDGVPAGPFDLVSAHFFHVPEPLSLDRSAVLRAAADALCSGGHLLIVDHGSAPSWSDHHDYPFPGAEEVLASLDLHAGEWQRVRVEAVDREVTGPDGQRATIKDNVMLLRRHASTLLRRAH
ncbi:bifunctional 2-polyprenyl-6-hydroxyphenol methylase/3-demethylubiquinol 3-O-methyltransferase UbiG [Mycobacterium sp. 1423905.2]|uniref:class I SAM-dependent methyltransferase n=1 Tax=Mycobacterium sp. 1423905.2 TaxID=1856859 RepID=UPI0007FF4C07|nr:class I SAM-dependent methyltransferase [Mycobacterium sp. 1423905.2]OBJ53426.1 SAM-dependent methyltransferase [Mycobacterium sp. 1423905.2]